MLILSFKSFGSCGSPFIIQIIPIVPIFKITVPVTRRMVWFRVWRTFAARYGDCKDGAVRGVFGLYLRFGGRNLSRIEREMRGLGYADFNRRILYSRTERGTGRVSALFRSGIFG